MDTNYSQILNLLEKETLNEEDKYLLRDIANKEPEAKTFLEAYKKLSKIINESSHISAEELGNYILIKSNLNADQSLSLKKYWLIDKHLKDCKFCYSVYNELSGELEESEGILNKYYDESKAEHTKAAKHTAYLFKNNLFKYSFISAVGIVVLFFGLGLFSNFITPKYYYLGKLNNKPLSSITRGTSSFEYQEGIAALDNGNYKEAISLFEKDIDKNINQASTFYAHYILGLTYMESAEKDFLGLFVSYDNKKIKKAVDNFNICISENNSGSYPDISFSSYYFMAKAELLLNNTDLAIKYLRIVVENKGSKMNEALELLKKLQ